MADLLILIAGSADPARSDYDPPLEDAATVPIACEQIGSALSRRGWRIMVYSGDQAFIEGHVVRGFASHLRVNAKDRIEVRYPHSEAHSKVFAEAGNKQQAFMYIQDRNDNWEASFYASIPQADGVILIGGGRSTHAVGCVALAFQVPLASVACFGGSARAVWRAVNQDVDLPSNADLQAMSPAKWDTGSANAVVETLTNQIKSKQARLLRAEDARRRLEATRRGIPAVLILLLAIMLTAWSFTAPGSNDSFLWWSVFLLVGPIAGAGSALASSAWHFKPSDPALLATASLGSVAGLVMSIFFVLAQVTTADTAAKIKPSAILIAMSTGLLAGFGVDRVMKQATDGKFKTPTAA